jgi:hypothetical protein
MSTDTTVSRLRQRVIEDMASPNLAGRSMGRSAGFVPPRIRPT